MGQAAEQLKNWATHYGLGVKILEGEAPPANDTDEPKTAVVPRHKWIHCANEGLYEGHHQGPFNLTRATFTSFVKNLREHPQYRAGSITLANGEVYTGGVEPVLQFDFEHASECPPWEGSIPKDGAPACAWVLDLAIRDGADGKAQLWAFADLLDDLRLAIGKRTQRWVSIAFALESTHWITKAPMGPMLTSIAITNHPFMLDLEPLAAANRPTSQQPRGRLGSANDPSEAPGVRSEPTRTGATMDEKLRERVCRALNIRLAATDAEVGEGVDKAIAGNTDLQTVLAALDVTLTGDALKVIPQLRDAKGKLEGALAELNSLLSQEQTADAVVAQTDVGAAMKSGGLAGDGAQKALTAYRSHLIDAETKALSANGATPKLSQIRTAIKAGREKFLAEYGVKDGATAHLSTSLVSGPGGQQLAAPKPSAPLSIDATQPAGEGEVVDLRGIDGPNTTLKLCAYLRKKEPGFEKLSREKQIRRASEYRQTVQLQE